MGVLVVLLLSIICFSVTAHSVHASVGTAVSPRSAPHHSGRHRHGGQVVQPPNTLHSNLSPVSNSPTKEAPPIALHKHHNNANSRFIRAAPEPSDVNSPIGSVSPSISPSSSYGHTWSTHVPSPTHSNQYNMPPITSPAVSPLASSLNRMNTPPPSSIMTLPPPPPNEDCSPMTCTEPYTYTLPGSPCGCVQPIQVRMRLGVELYTFFPLVSELAREISASISMNQSQVRIMGADAATQQTGKTIVLINLIPLGSKFNATISYSTYEKFWNKKVSIKSSLFGTYDVLYVHYPGLPPSPPTAPSNIAGTSYGLYPDHDNDGRTIKPLGVDIPRTRKDGLNGSLIAIIALSSLSFFVICMALTWILILKCGFCVHQPLFLTKRSGPSGSILLASRMSSATNMSIRSSKIPYTGSAKTFSLNEMERATNNFDDTKILGEGGFGLVYKAILDDGTEVAVKVLKRDDQQGGREFLAEVEMLSRLHHRNLVKLIGICAEDHTRCLVYELISNGSVESHLHGIDKERDPLDWHSRMKIALGAARGLAYLHEDSSPHVIHRDFKSSNILLEDDFTPKVSDFGLARAELDEGKKQTSTRVMGTFGYLAPEYAMTGHLLVKSDVYSYGVVLLELLTGRKPVDMSQPPGEENLVSWARPLLTSREGLETILDQNLESYIPFDTVAKVSAIASMCVQPEVSHRPFMGEVVQALKLVCSEFDETKELGSRTPSKKEDDFFNNNASSKLSGEFTDTCYQMPRSDSRFETRITLSTSDLVSASEEFGSVRRCANSGPLVIGKRRQFWQRLRRFSRGSTSEHGSGLTIWPGSH